MKRLVGVGTAVLAINLYCAELLADSYVRKWVEMPVAEDPLPRMPGTQPAGVQNMPIFELDNPDECYECHGLGFNKYSEPGFNWSGSMMSQSARDPLFWSSLFILFFIHIGVLCSVFKKTASRAKIMLCIFILRR